MNIALIGYRGTGKSTIGRRLAEALEMTYVCFDAEIVRRAGMTIPEIVEHHSWDDFRDMESRVVADFAALDRQILDTGGGVITRPENVTVLRQNALVILLVATIEDIVERIGSTTDRPSLTGTRSFVDEIQEVLEQRRPLYEASADYRIDTSAHTPDEIVSEIAELFRRTSASKPERK